ncbi:MAG: hypothetical protein H7X83_06000 [Verrucomicrobia bacterium]|nr:hypothetical protein [Deltaproteobacteria bacterium]
MRAKPCIVGWILLLTLTVAGTKQAVCAATAAPVSAGPGGSVQWKSIAEDSTSWRREPFKSPEATKHATGTSVKQASPGTSADLTLQGIMKSNRRYYAIFNGTTVKPGDHIEGWTIAGISRHRVTIRREKETQIHDIYQGRIDRGTR